VDLGAKENIGWKTTLDRIVGEINGHNGEGAILPKEIKGQIKWCNIWTVSKINFGE